MYIIKLQVLTILAVLLGMVAADTECNTAIKKCQTEYGSDAVEKHCHMYHNYGRHLCNRHWQCLEDTCTKDAMDKYDNEGCSLANIHNACEPEKRPSDE